ncbi:hypothetical protein L7F22_016235 [Adiantum nelumboides]|nr:hypothetical protein [Adiantum nelumboides]
MQDAQPHEVKKLLDDLKQRLDCDFKAFEWEFEVLWRKLLEVTAAENCDYLKLSKFMECLHEDVHDKVEVDGPTTYADVVAYARGCTKKLLKKRQASQGMLDAVVSKPIESIVVKTQPMLENFPVIQEEQRVLWLQRDGAFSRPKMPIKEVQFMEEPFKSMDEVEKSQACSDASWETGSYCSMYEEVDILHVEEAIKEHMLEDHDKLQEDVVDIDLMKEPKPTNEDMQGKEDGLSEDKGVQKVLPLLMRGKAKQWFDGIHDEVKTDCDALDKAFQQKYMQDAQPHEVKKKLDDLKHRLDGDFKAFEWEFEVLWRKLLEVTAAKNCDYLKLSKLMECQHEDVRDKVEVDGPTTYADVVAYARGHTKKLLKKRQASQRMLDAVVSKPVEAVAVKTQPMFASYTRGAKGLDGQVSLGFARGQRVRFADKVEEIPNLETHEEMESDSNSSMDTDASWETGSYCSRYEEVDILHVEEAKKEHMLEENHDKVQEDVLNVDLMKEPKPTNEDMQLVQSLSRKDEVVLVVEKEQVCFMAHEEDSQVVTSSKPSKEGMKEQVVIEEVAVKQEEMETLELGIWEMAVFDQLVYFLGSPHLLLAVVSWVHPLLALERLVLPFFSSSP